MQQLTDDVFVETDYMGVNVAAIVSERGVICIDAPSHPHDARHWATRIQHLSPHGIRFVILTDYHPDRLLNLRWYRAPLIVHRNTATKLQEFERRYPESFLHSLSVRANFGARHNTGLQASKPQVVFSDDMTLQVPQPIVLQAMPGPTAGNVTVHLPAANLFFTGDIVVVNHHPMLLESNSGPWLVSLRQLYGVLNESSTLVPGRGPVGNINALTPVMDYLQELRADVEFLIAASEPRTSCRQLVDKYLPLFPGLNSPQKWLAQQIQFTLECVYDELKLVAEEESTPLA